MGQVQFITCPKCTLKFDAEEFVDGECPDCGNEFVWEEEPYGGASAIWESEHDDSWEITKLMS